MKLITLMKAAEILGVHTSTLRKWTNEGKVECIRTLGKHRRYQEEYIKNFLKGENNDKKSD